MSSRTGRLALLAGFVVVAAILFVVLQGSDDDSDSDSAQTTTEQATEAGGVTAPAETEEAEPATEVIRVRDGAPVGGVKELTYTAGDQVRIRVDLEQPQEDVHIHGYDIEVLNPQKAADFDFKADIEGIFELEAHGPSGDIVLAEIRVEPS